MALAVALAAFALGLGVGAVLPSVRRLAGPLDAVVVAVLLPAVVLAKVPAIPLTAASALPAAVAWGTLAVAAVAVLLVARARRWDRKTVGTLLLVVPLGNTSFLGFAMVEALLGHDRLPPAITYDQLGSFLGLATFGSAVAARYGGARADVRAVVRRILVFPPFLALLASLPLRAWPLPHLVQRGLVDLGVLLAPVALAALGLRLRPSLPRRTLAPAGLAIGVRLLALPALALAAALLAGGAHDPAWQASVLEAGTPPMVTAGVVAVEAGLDADLAGAAVGVGLLVSLVSLPLLGLLLRAT